MADELLPYYNRELAYVRKLAADFADQHPKIAGRLRVSADAVEDPHVERLIEAVAFMNARLRHKLDDDFPELTDALLGVLYPHYLAPIPSMAIIQFAGQADLDVPFEVAAGTEVETEPVGGETCRFRTCYPTTLWPITIDKASLSGRPLVAPANPGSANAVAVLRLSLRCLGPEMTFTQLAPESLRFFLRAPPSQVYPLHELIHNNTVSVALADSAADPNPVILPADCIRPVGFGRDDGVIPYSPRSFVGYRLLTEYFTFPEKFLFFDIDGLAAKVMVEAGNKLEIFIYLDRLSGDLEQSVSTDSFALGCVPMVNLFSQRAEPIAVTHESQEYRVVPNLRRQNAMEVYAVDRVALSTADGKSRRSLPFYSVKHALGPRDDAVFWHPSRRPAGAAGAGSEVFLSFVDPDLDPFEAAEAVASVDVTCLNRDLPENLPYGGGHPHLQLVEGSAPIAAVSCVTPPTSTLRPHTRRGGFWRLISHLSLNHLSLTDGADGADALREILKLYDFRDSAETAAVIDSVLSVASRRVSTRAPGRATGAFCQGMEVTVQFDPKGFSGSGLFLLAQVLERFLPLYCSINSFTRLIATVKGRQGVLRKWPPRAGDKVLL